MKLLSQGVRFYISGIIFSTKSVRVVLFFLLCVETRIPSSGFSRLESFDFANWGIMEDRHFRLGNTPNKKKPPPLLHQRQSDLLSL